jgi:hypothetical protein
VGDYILLSRTSAHIKTVLGLSFSSVGFACDLFVPKKRLEKLRNIIINGRNAKKK